MLCYTFVDVLHPLCRHPREVRSNKDVAGAIINKWSRPIFHLSADFSALTREDRQVRDQEMAAKLGLNKRKRKDSSQGSEGGAGNSSSGGGDSAKSVRPGDPGWVSRARVPMPNNKEFVRRPEWQSHEDMTTKTSTKKEIDMLEKHKRSFADRKKFAKAQHAVKISLEGKGMKL